MKLTPAFWWGLAACAVAPLAQAEIIASASFSDVTPGALQGKAGGNGFAGVWEYHDFESSLPNYEVVATGTTPLVYSVVAGGMIDGGTQAVRTAHGPAYTRNFAAGVNLRRDIYVRYLLRFNTSNRDFMEEVFFFFRTDPYRSVDGSPVFNQRDFTSFWSTKILNASDGRIGGSATPLTVTAPVPLQINKTYLIVGKLRYNAAVDGYDRMEMWIDPRAIAPGAANLVFEQAGVFAPVADFTGLRFLHGRGANLDEIVVATTWDEVVPPSLTPIRDPIAVAGNDQSLTADAIGFFTDAPVTLSAADSVDADGTIASATWRIGNRIIATGLTPAALRLPVGTHDIVLTVTDNEGRTGTDSLRVVIAGTAQTPTYNDWAGIFFQGDVGNAGTEATVWGLLADPNRDGRPNIIPYALNFDATSNGRFADLTLPTITESALTFRYPLVKFIPGAQVTLEWTADFKTWRTDLVEERVVQDGDIAWLIEASIPSSPGVVPVGVRLRFNKL